MWVSEFGIFTFFSDKTSIKKIDHVWIVFRYRSNKFKAIANEKNNYS